MKNKIKKLSMLFFLIIVLLNFYPSDDVDLPIWYLLVFEIFSTFFVVIAIKPIIKAIAKENSKSILWIIMIIRTIIIFHLAAINSPDIFILDFFLSIFIYMILLLIGDVIPSDDLSKNIVIPPALTQVAGIELKCAKCNTPLKITDKVCPKCGEPFDGNNVVVSEKANAKVTVPPKNAIIPADFDSMYRLSEDELLTSFIDKELTKAGIDKSSKLIPVDVLKRKKVLNIIFSVLVFIYISLIFFHLKLSVYFIGLIILIIFFRLSRKYNLIKYLKKEIQARPSEKILNIVMNVKNNFVEDSSKRVFAIYLLIALLVPLIVFYKPIIIYEKADNGYAVRFYAFGLTNYKSVTIPEYYKNEKVVTLRGNTFSNMYFLESVVLPDSITEIRGQAFKNCRTLEEINIPKNVVYIGGGAFYEADSLKSIELPDTLEFLGGESFYGANSLEYVKLSSNLTEIRGDTFKYCSSLKEITIPDSVTRIGGHAFYGNTSLTNVYISENSKLNEIGSSAFRECYSLETITIPNDTYVNERAFKDSPTVIMKYFDYGSSITCYHDYTGRYICNDYVG